MTLTLREQRVPIRWIALFGVLLAAEKARVYAAGLTLNGGGRSG
jgi:hypothetical protein